jgi:hypothetical protein
MSGNPMPKVPLLIAATKMTAAAPQKKRSVNIPICLLPHSPSFIRCVSIPNQVRGVKHLAYLRTAETFARLMHRPALEQIFDQYEETILHGE